MKELKQPPVDKIAGGDPRVGTTIEKYEILEKLGQGGMGVVYKARHSLIKRIFALKVLSQGLVGDETSRARFEQEAQAASGLNHQNLIAVTDYGIDDGQGCPFLVMDYVEGTSLSKVLDKEGKLAPDRLLGVARQICAGLVHAHGKGLVHRDLKPSNIMLVDDGGQELVKIIDFGIVKKTGSNTGKQLTQTGDVFGTPHYMSPEQCLGQRVDARTDLYSCACLLYEALAGQPPYNGETAMAVAVKQIHDPFPPLPSDVVATPLGRSLANIVERAMAKDPEKRYQSASEMLADLNRCSPDAILVPKFEKKLDSDARRFWFGLAFTAVFGVGSIAGWNFVCELVRQATQPPPAAKPVAQSMINYAEQAENYRNKGLKVLGEAQASGDAGNPLLSVAGDSLLQAKDSAKKAWGDTIQTREFLKPIVAAIGSSPIASSSGLPILDYQVELTRKLAPEELPDLLYTTGNAHQNHLEYEKAFSSYQEALVLMQKQKNPDKMKLANCFYMLGEVYRATRQYAESAKCFADAIHLYPADHPFGPLQIAQAKLRLGIDLGQLGDSDKADKLIAEALPALKTTPKFYELATATIRDYYAKKSQPEKLKKLGL